MTLLPSIVVAMGICEPSASASRLVLQAEAVDFDADHDRRPLTGVQPALGFVHRFGQHFGIAD